MEQVFIDASQPLRQDRALEGLCAAEAGGDAAEVQCRFKMQKLSLLDSKMFFMSP